MQKRMIRMLALLLCLALPAGVSAAAEAAIVEMTAPEEILNTSGEDLQTAEAPQESIAPAESPAPEASTAPELPTEPETSHEPETPTVPETSAAPELSPEPSPAPAESAVPANSPVPDASPAPENSPAPVPVLPESILPAESEIVLGVGEEYSIAGWALLPADAVDAVRFSSDNERIARVSPEGVVTGVAQGKTQIRLSCASGPTALIQVTVKKAPGSVKITAERTKLGAGEQLQLGYTLSSGSAGKVKFESLNPEFAEVTADGLLTAVAPGRARIRARAYNGKNRVVSFTVTAAPEALTLDETEIRLGTGQETVLGYSLNAAAAGQVRFESADPAIVSVSSGGCITALAVGETEITATTYNGLKAVCRVSVLAAPERISLAAERTILGVKEKMQLEVRFEPESTAAELRYASSKASVAAVSAEGMVTAKKAGTAVITATASNGASAEITITVKKAPSRVTVSGRGTYGVGESCQLEYALSSGSAGAVAFRSLNEAVATVTADGLLTAIAPGTATIRAETFNGKRANFKIEVLPAPETIAIAPGRAVIGAGDGFTLSACVPDGTYSACSFSSAHPEIAAVDEKTGAVKALAEGETTITVTACNGVSASMALRVGAEVQQLQIQNLEKNEAGEYVLEMLRGESLSLALDLGEYTRITHSLSCAGKAVKLSKDGVVTALSHGSAKITFTAYSGAQAVVNVTVQKITELYPDVRAIMHAMGAVDGKVYSNSREAFLKNYAAGNRLFEIDLAYTSDDELVLWHSWKNNRINSDTKPGYIPSEKEFARMQVFDAYDSLTYRDLLELMAEYPDAYFYMDTKQTSSSAVRRQYRKMVSVAKEMGLEDTLNRMIPMIYNKEMMSTVSGVHDFNQYVFACYKYFDEKPTEKQMRSMAKFCADNGIDMFNMWDYWWEPEYIQIAEEYGLTVNLHTVNSAQEARNLVQQGVRLITTDSLSVGIL